jgi:hypothetical protein
MIRHEKNTNNKIGLADNKIEKKPRYSRFDYFSAREYFRQLFKEQDELETLHK